MPHRPIRRARLCAVLIAAACVCAVDCAVPEGRAEAGPGSPLWFDVGEELIYRIYWGNLPVGTCRITTEWVEQDGRRLLAIRGRAQGNRILARIYPVNDFIESLIDPQAFLPVRLDKQISEGRYKSREITTFDHAQGTAVWRSLTRNKEQTVPIQPHTRDLVGFMYYFRSVGAKPGQVEQYQVMLDEKLYDLWLRVGLLESIHLPRYGDVPSLRVDPEAAFQGRFVRKGAMTIWASNDKRCLITRIVVSVPVGSIKIVLDQVRGPGTDFWVRMLPKEPAPDE